MAELRIVRPQHGEFDAGVSIERGSTGVFRSGAAACPTGGHLVPIPDGVYGVNAFGLVARVDDAPPQQ